MTTATAPVGTVFETRSLRTLAWVEARRYARNPIFLIGALLLVWTSAALADDGSADVMGLGFFPAFFIGVFGCVVAYRLTRSTEASVEAMDCAPVTVTRRTAALCLACLVPATFVAIWWVCMLVALQIWPPPGWAFAGTSGLDRFVVLIGTTVLACLGGPMLGVAAGRWLRFPGGGILVAAGLIAMTMITFVGRSTANPDALWSTAVRLLSPYQFFTETGGEEVQTWVMRYPGFPLGYLLWQLALCGLAAVAALLFGAEGATRSRLRLWGLGLAVVAVTGYALAVLAGPDQSTVHHDDGTVTVGPSAPGAG